MDNITLHENLRSHNFDIIIYEDSTDYDYKIVLNLVRSSECYAFIKHDLDTNEDGSLKKAHFHIILHYHNCRTIKTVSNYLGVPSNYINSISSLKGAIRYLVHRDHDTKFQYSIDCIFYSDNFSDRISYAFYNDKSDRDILLSMKNYIDSCKSLTLSDFFSWCIDNNYEKVFKKYYYIFRELILTKHD